MEKKVLLKKLVEEGRHIRKEFTPTAIVSDYGTRPIGEFWDANKTVDVIVNGAHAVHDTVRELDEFTESEVRRLDNVKVGRIGWDSNNPITDIKALTNAQIDSLKIGDTVIKTTGDEKHSYTVVYKKDDEMSLVYADHWTIEEVYYEKRNGVWTHIVTDSLQPQEKLVSGQNIATVAGHNLLEGGDIDIQATVMANEPFPSSWRTNETMEQLISDINNDESVIPGKIYLKTVTISDLPAGMSQAEMKVEIMGQQAGEFIMVFSVSSATTSPYKWEYSSYNEHHGPSTVTIPSIPADVSYFNNDAGYLTSHQDLTSLEQRIAALEAVVLPSNAEE